MMKRMPGGSMIMPALLLAVSSMGEAPLGDVATNAQREAASKNIVHFKFNEGSGTVLHDRSGNTNDAKICGCQWVKGRHGPALFLNGKGDYVDCGEGDRWSLAGPFAIECWIMSDIYGRGRNDMQNIIDCDVFRVWLNSYPSGETLVFFDVRYLADDQKTIRGETIYGGGPLQLEEWYHIAGIYDGQKITLFVNGQVCKCYKDGKLVDSVVIKGNLAPGKANPKIGAYVKYNDMNFGGVIDEVALYNQALTPAEIEKHYKAGKP